MVSVGRSEEIRNHYCARPCCLFKPAPPFQEFYFASCWCPSSSSPRAPSLSALGILRVDPPLCISAFLGPVQISSRTPLFIFSFAVLLSFFFCYILPVQFFASTPSLIFPNFLGIFRVFARSIMSSSTSSSSSSRSLSVPAPENLSSVDESRLVFVPGTIPCSLTPEELSLIRIQYGVLPEYELGLPEPIDRASAPPPGCFCLYQEAFRTRLRLSLLPFVIALFHFLNISLVSIAPNSFRFLIGFLSLYRLAEVQSTLSLFRNFYTFKHHPSIKD